MEYSKFGKDDTRRKEGEISTNKLFKVQLSIIL